MRGVRCVAVVAGVVVAAAACGTVTEPAANLASAAANTIGQRARLAETTVLRVQGRSISITETGVFDFAHARGLLRVQGPAGSAGEALFIPPQTYIKVPGGAGGMLPDGKSWIAMRAAGTAGFGDFMLGPAAGANPADLLSMLREISASVTTLGAGTVRGVRVTHYRVIVDPAKAAARMPRSERAGFRALAKTMGTKVPVDVWVDHQNLVRRVKTTLHMPAGKASHEGLRITQTLDFYDFGVPVHVSPQPASQVATTSQLAKAGRFRSFMTGASGSPRPPRVSGALSPAQAAAAEQAVRAFWSALARHDSQAAALAVLPGQRPCFRAIAGGPRFTVTSLRMVSAEPAGRSAATVRFTMKVRASISGHVFPVFPPGRKHLRWLVVSRAGGHWYVDVARSSLVFGPACSRHNG